jgi:hypothetical protein
LRENAFKWKAALRMGAGKDHCEPGAKRECATDDTRRDARHEASSLDATATLMTSLRWMFYRIDAP